MDVDRLASSPIGFAFLPDRLPRSVELSTATWNQVTAATAALARLDGAARLIPNPELLRTPSLRREAQSTSALEGTFAPVADVLAADEEDARQLSAQMREILNFELMAELAFSWPAERPLTLGMLGDAPVAVRIWMQSLELIVIVVQLLRGNVIREPLLVVSPWFEQRRELYQDGLLDLSVSGDWDKWIRFFAEGITAAATRSREKVERLIELQRALRSQVQHARKRGVAEQLAADLIGTPFVSRRAVANRYGISGQGAGNAIDALVSLGILKPTAMRAAKGAQLFECREVVDVLGS